MSNVEHANAVEAHTAAQGYLNEAVGSGKWLMAIAIVEPDGKIGLRRTTCDFPQAAFESVVKILEEDLTAEIERTKAESPSEPSPLPAADFSDFLVPSNFMEGVSEEVATSGLDLNPDGSRDAQAPEEPKDDPKNDPMAG